LIKEEENKQEAVAQMFLHKKFAFKPAGATSVANVIKKVGIFNND
jgi:hypothetical protein